MLAVGFAALAAWSGLAAQWIVLAASIAIAGWFSELALRSLR